MSKVINSYETVLVISTRLGEEEIKAMVEKFTDMIAKAGTVEKVDEWGVRRLAYEIQDQQEGYYVVINFNSTPELPAELERVYRITDGLLRSLVVKL